jgi:hypothetical protein
VFLLSAALQADPGPHPDFSGLYMPSRDFSRFKGFPMKDLPYTDWARRYADEFTSIYDPNKDQPAFICVPPGMPASMALGAPFPLEVIQRPNDITMFFEAYFQYRKIYLEGYDRPDPVLPTNMGYSVGHWEGDTLVVVTGNLAERTQGTTILSSAARIEERMTIEIDDQGNKSLVDHITYIDPKAYTSNIEMTGIWNWSPDTPILEYVCTNEIYQQYLERVKDERLKEKLKLKQEQQDRNQSQN